MWKRTPEQSQEVTEPLPEESWEIDEVIDRELSQPTIMASETAPKHHNSFVESIEEAVHLGHHEQNAEAKQPAKHEVVGLVKGGEHESLMDKVIDHGWLDAIPLPLHHHHDISEAHYEAKPESTELVPGGDEATLAKPRRRSIVEVVEETLHIPHHPSTAHGAQKASELPQKHYTTADVGPPANGHRTELDTPAVAGTS